MGVVAPVQVSPVVEFGKILLPVCKCSLDRVVRVWGRSGNVVSRWWDEQFRQCCGLNCLSMSWNGMSGEWQ